MMLTPDEARTQIRQLLLDSTHKILTKESRFLRGFCADLSVDIRGVLHKTNWKHDICEKCGRFEK